MGLFVITKIPLWKLKENYNQS